MFSRFTQSVKSGFQRLPKSWVAGSAVAGFVGASAAVAMASSDALHHPHYEWTQNGFFSSYDTASLRRGFEVYRQVCSTCHSLQYINYRNLVGVTHTEEQAKALAESVQVKDGPNDEGEMFERKGKLSDKLPSPYPNEEYARFVNGGALPPDLSLMVKARMGASDYLYALLTGYKEPPHGVQLRAGLHYNPYFIGGAISMPPPLNEGGVEYEDGTEATVPQMAKDVSHFLAWCAEPEHDERKLAGAKVLSFLAVSIVLSGYYKRFRWNVLKTRRVSWVNSPRSRGL